ncbi:TonB-dependent siderophore receptor [Acetobacter okinawensis]|uniref:TonB-dependent siderophore receptor n=1 Tax=Acetobacter okinawensis TaxID=1076594 RepID=UPI00209D9371|nr:TonB-dependent siderophore receptor [Acetobacter okinawensis]MCP1214020.1 TonB-dependent siderophore receptor [Acetobacter okinawensis]
MLHVLPTGRRLGISMMLALGTSLSALGGSPAFAQQGQTTVPSIHLDIPRQPLSAALQAFSRRTGIQVVYAASIDAGIISPGISGDFDVMTALSRLLSGTGVTFRQSRKGAVVLAKASASIPLGPVRVGGIVAHQDPKGPGVGYVAENTLIGTKTDTPLTEIPNSIYVVTKQEMVDQQPQNVREALRYLPGVRTEISGMEQSGASVNSGGDIMQRGFQTTQFVDGLMSTSQAGGETAFLDRIEVLNGPASVMYGQVTPGGMINMSLKTPTNTPLHQVSLGFGNWGRYESTLDMSDKITKSGNVRYRIAAIGDTQGTQIDHVNYHRVGVLPSITWDIDRKTSLTLVGSYMYTPGTGVTPAAQYPIQGTLLIDEFRRISRSTFLGFPNWNEESVKDAMFEYQFKHKSNKYIKFSQTFRWEKSEKQRKVSFNDGAADDVENQYYYSNLTHAVTNTAGMDARFSGQFSTGPVSHTWVIGSDFRDYHYNWETTSDSTSEPIINVYNPTASYIPCFSMAPSSGCSGTRNVAPYDYFQEGVYFQDQIKWKRLSILLGGREDWVNYSANVTKTKYNYKNGDSINSITQTDVAPQPGHAFTWRAGFTYKFKFGLTPYFSYATSFVPQTSTDWQGHPFSPLTGEQYEAGLKYKIPNREILLTASAFHIMEDHYLISDQQHSGYSSDAGRVKSQGFEISANANVTKQIRVVASYSFTDARFGKSNLTDQKIDPRTGASYGAYIREEGHSVPYIPRNMFSIFANYSFRNTLLDGFSVNGGIRYTGFSFADNVESFKSPDYLLFDIGASYNLGKATSILKGLNAQISISNLTNKYYITSCDSWDCYVGQGRRVYGNLTYNW